jgi:putative intracellular protease/amidase
MEKRIAILATNGFEEVELSSPIFRATRMES